jgi:phosphomannomutase/phosphoglucomutase
VTLDASIFREYDIRGVVGTQLTADSVSLVAKSIAAWLAGNSARRVAVGHDARVTSPEFCEILTREFTDAGLDVSLIGMVPTPVLYHAVYTLQVDGGVMITGSHNPPEHNGFKICLGRQTLYGPQIREIRCIALEGSFIKDAAAGCVERIDALSKYLADLKQLVTLPGRKLKVVVDAGNGTGGITAVPLYRFLGCDLTELYTDPNPAFPNHDPDPSVEANLADLVAEVKNSGADVGIAFDGDGDRLAVVDDTGRIWWGDEILTLFERQVLSDSPGSIVIAEAKCSQTLFDDIERQGGVPLMWKAGHSIIKAKMQETGALLAGEMSGHFFFADRYYGFDDACYAGARLLEILSRTDRPLSTLLSGLQRLISTPEIRVPCTDDRKFDVATEVAGYFGRDHEVNTIDGARITFDHGWGIVRPSNTQDLLILRFEADTQEHLDEIRNDVESKVRELIG